MTTILLCVLLIACSWIVVGLSLWLGLRWLKVPQVSYRHVTLAVFSMVVLALAVHLSLARVTADPALLGVGWLFRVSWLLEIGANVFGSWLVIKSVFRASLIKAVLSWLFILPVDLLNLAAVWFVILPYMLETFIVPNNSMAPTLLGPHRLATCPHCGKAVVLFYDPTDQGGLESDGEDLGICESCMRTARVRPDGELPRGPDRFICNKLLSVKRWDLVVFRSPARPEFKYVKRLVGLPGEEIVIKEGAMWVNGTRQDPPPEIAQLEFTYAPERGTGKSWGSPERPARLGEDEYFVVGDFLLRSSDSRTWTIESGGRLSYALPRSHIEGVVTVVYWPPARWRIFR
jgi:signal peptidase I